MPDNVNPNANSEESARKLGDITTHSINEPGEGAPKPFKVSDEQAYPGGLEKANKAQKVEEDKAEKSKPHSAHAADPDDLEDEMEEEGYSTKSHGKPKRK